jgi:hypothetical protein
MRFLSSCNDICSFSLHIMIHVWWSIKSIPRRFLSSYNGICPSTGPCTCLQEQSCPNGSGARSARARR